MRNTRMFILSFVVVFSIAALFGCDGLSDVNASSTDGNYSEEDQKVAEEHAITKSMISGSLWVARETIYDAPTDRYIVLLVATNVYRGEVVFPIEEIKDVTPKVAIVGVEDGRVSTFESDEDSHYYWAKWSVDKASDKITVTGPDGQEYEFDLSNP